MRATCPISLTLLDSIAPAIFGDLLNLTLPLANVFSLKIPAALPVDILKHVVMSTPVSGLSGIRFPVGEIDFSLLRNVQTGFEIHPPSYSTGTWGLLLQG
jgi:hypothetical protein